MNNKTDNELAKRKLTYHSENGEQTLIVKLGKSRPDPKLGDD